MEDKRRKTKRMAEKDNQQPEKVNTPNSSDGEDETMDITSDEDKRKKKKRIAIKDYQQPETTIIPNSIDGGDDISDEDETQDIPSDSPENEEEDYLTVQDAKIVISVMFEAIRFSDVSKAQLVSAAKKFKLKSDFSSKDMLALQLSKIFIEEKYVLIKGNLSNLSRDIVKKMKVF